MFQWELVNEANYSSCCHVNESFSRLEFMVEGKRLQGMEVQWTGYARRYNNSHFRLSSSRPNPDNQSNTESLEHDTKKRRRGNAEEC